VIAHVTGLISPAATGCDSGIRDDFPQHGWWAASAPASTLVIGFFFVWTSGGATWWRVDGGSSCPARRLHQFGKPILLSSGRRSSGNRLGLHFVRDGFPSSVWQRLLHRVCAVAATYTLVACGGRRPSDRRSTGGRLPLEAL